MRRSPQAPRAFLCHICGLGLTGLELRRFLRFSARPLRPGFRVNVPKAARDVVGQLKRDGWDVSPVPWCDGGFFVDGSPSSTEALGHSRMHMTGEIYIQEPTSMLPVEVLFSAVHRTGTKRSGFRVLDLCAAPGSKTTQLGAWLSDGDLIVANEPNPRRARNLRTNLLRAGISNFILTVVDGRAIGHLAPEAFDAVLVDAPCSCEGNVRKDASVLARWCNPSHSDEINRMAALQRELIESGWRALRPGGCLVYSTCTVNAEENEGTSRRLLDAHPSASALDIRELLDLSQDITSDGYLRIWPQAFDVEGFFVSCFQKSPQAGHIMEATPPSSDTSIYSRLQHLEDNIAAEVRAAVIDRLGFWPEGLGTLAKDGKGMIWALPNVRQGLESLAIHSQEPGIQVALASLEGSFDVSDELLLLVGDRASARAARMTLDEWVVLAARHEGSQTSLNASVNSYASSGDISGAESVIEGMQEQRVEADVISYTSLMKAYVRAGHRKDAGNILQVMRQKRLEPNVVSYTLMMKAHAMQGDLAGAKGIIVEMQEQGLSPNLVSYNTLMDIYADAGDVAGAEGTLEEMQRQRIVPTSFSYNTLVKAHAKNGGAIAAQKAIANMQERHISLGPVSYNTLISECAVSGDFAMAEDVFSQMHKLAIKPDLDTYIVLINAHARGNDVVGTKQIIADMHHQRFEPNLMVHNMLINAYAGDGKVSAAKDAFADVCRQALEPNIVSFTALMKGYTKQGDLAEADQILSSMTRQVVQPNAVTYRTLMNAHAKAGNVARIEDILEGMRQQNLEPNVTDCIMLDKARSR